MTSKKRVLPWAFLAAGVSVSYLFSPLLCRGETNYQCYLMKAPVSLNGDTGKPEWQGLPEAGGFHILHCAELAPYKQTFFRIGWDTDNLYLGIRCDEPDIRAITVVSKNGGQVCTDDAIEVFLAPGYPDYHQFLVNAAGSRASILNQPVNKERTFEGWDAWCIRGDNFWSAEIRIPFSTLGKTPADGEEWRLNIARDTTTTQGKGGGYWHTTWAVLKEGGFHDSRNFRVIQFRKCLPGQAMITVQSDVSAQFLEFTRRSIRASLDAIRSGSSGREETLKKVSSLEKAAEAPNIAPSCLWNTLSQARKIEEEVALFNLEQLLK